jgi:hypothetical protein
VSLGGVGTPQECKADRSVSGNIRTVQLCIHLRREQSWRKGGREVYSESTGHEKGSFSEVFLTVKIFESVVRVKEAPLHEMI